MGIFSENRPEWFMTELSCCSDSICIVPVAIETQFMNEARIVNLINQTEMKTICVSSSTIGVILDLKSKEKLPFLKNLILYDQSEDIHISLASQVGFELYSFYDLVSEGQNLPDYDKQEPKSDSVLLLGVTSGTTGEPKAAMLTHLNFISG